MLLSFDLDDEWWEEKDWLLAHFGVAVESEADGEALVRFELPCRHLIAAVDGQPAACRINDHKPKVCREYPDEETLEYLKNHPEVTPGCGYAGGGIEGGGRSEE